MARLGRAFALLFAMDWPLCEDQLHELERYAEQGLLSASQRQRYDTLLTLVGRYRPALDRLIEG